MNAFEREKMKETNMQKRTENAEKNVVVLENCIAELAEMLAYLDGAVCELAEMISVIVEGGSENG